MHIFQYVHINITRDMEDLICILVIVHTEIDITPYLFSAFYEKHIGQLLSFRGNLVIYICFTDL